MPVERWAPIGADGHLSPLSSTLIAFTFKIEWKQATMAHPNI